MILCQCAFKSVLFYLNYLVIWQNWKDYKIECFECLSFWYFRQQNLLSSLLVYLLMNLHNLLEVKHEFTYFYNIIITVFKTFVHVTSETREIEWKISWQTVRFMNTYDEEYFAKTFYVYSWKHDQITPHGIHWTYYTPTYHMYY